MRLSKRNPDKLKAIAAEVMASPAGLFAGNADEWKFVSSTNFARGGNWNAQRQPAPVAAKPSWTSCTTMLTRG